MTQRDKGIRGIVVYSATLLAGSISISALLYAKNLSLEAGNNGAFLGAITTMWMPALARLVTTRTVDRGWCSPFKLRKWGQPRSAIILVPLAIVCAIYLGAYGMSTLMGIPRETPAWEPSRIALNVAVNLPLLAIIGLFGAIGEEIGWQGYLQPRLHQLELPLAPLWGAVLGTGFHIPIILMGGYLASRSAVASLMLAFGLSVGVTLMWTWATFQWRTIWIAIWFHTLHNAISQVLAPKALGAGDPLILGEAGVLPVVLYLVAAATVIGISSARGRTWRVLAKAVTEGPDAAREPLPS